MSSVHVYIKKECFREVRVKSAYLPHVEKPPRGPYVGMEQPKRCLEGKAPSDLVFDPVLKVS